MKKLLTITCGSYTTVMVLFALLSPCDLAPLVTNRTALQMFIMCATIASVMVILERIQNDSFLFDVLIKVFICYLVVFLEGAFFGMIDFAWVGLLQISPVLIPAFIITYFFQYQLCVEWVNKINKSIKHRK